MEESPNAEEKKPIGGMLPLSKEEIDKRIKGENKRVLFLMDELRSIFIPEMRLTFIARDPRHPKGTPHTFLTDDQDVESLICSIRSIATELKPVQSNKTGEV